MAKKIIFVLSLAFNALCIALFVFAVRHPVKRSAFAFYNMEQEGGRYKACAAIAAVPLEDALAAFGPFEITLRPGQRAALQYSVIANEVQLNVSGDPLYDRAVIRAEQSGFGLIIHALSIGETVIQTLGSEGIHDVARIIVR